MGSILRLEVMMNRRRVCHKLREKGYTLQQIGDIFGLTRQRVDQLLRNSDYATKLEIKRNLRQESQQEWFARERARKKLVSFISQYRYNLIMKQTMTNNLSGNFCKILLPHGMEAFVDTELFGYLTQWKWHARKGNPKAKQPRFYVARNRQDKWGLWHTHYLHWEILPRIIGMDVDHINGNSLDNRRCNLRYLSHKDNIKMAYVNKKALNLKKDQ